MSEGNSIFKRGMDDIFDIENRQKEDNEKNYNIFETFFYFPTRKKAALPHESEATNTEERKTAFEEQSDAMFALEIILYIVGLGFIVHPLQALARLALELPFLMAGITLKNYKNSLQDIHSVKKTCLNIAITFVMLPHWLFRCVLAPIQSLERIWALKQPKIVRILLCIVSLTITFTGYTAIAATLLGVPLLPLISGKPWSIMTHIATHVSNMLSFKVSTLLHKYVLGKLIPEIILASRILVGIFFTVKETYAFCGHEDLRDKSIFRKAIKTIKGWFVSSKNTSSSDTDRTTTITTTATPKNEQTITTVVAPSITMALQTIESPIAYEAAAPQSIKKDKKSKKIKKEKSKLNMFRFFKEKKLLRNYCRPSSSNSSRHNKAAKSYF